MNRERINVLQVAKIRSQKCGIALFAGKLEDQMQRAGVDVMTVDRLPQDISAGVVLLQYHEELFCDNDVFSMAATCPVPLILFVHSEVADRITMHMDGLVAMCGGMVGSTDKPVHIFPHPAWTPSRLEDRMPLRREFNKPEDRTMVGAHGFLKFERQFAEMVEALLPEAQRHGWFVELLTSPWRLDSPGLVPKLEYMRDRHPEHFGFEYAFFDTPALNRRLQACDLLWCWTATPSSFYASGVISDQYASGTRIFATNKMQHSHVLALPNVVAGPDEMEPFVEGLIAELRACDGRRHDPRLVSWDRCIHDLAAFLKSVAATNG